MRSYVVLTLIVAVSPALSYAQAVRRPAPRPSPAAKAPARDVEGEERARQLAEELQSIAKALKESDPAGSLATLAAQAASHWPGPYFEKMKACVPHWQEMSSAAETGRPSDLARAALQGHMIVDALFVEVSDRSQENESKLMAILAKDKPNLKELERARKELELGPVTTNYLLVALDTFDMAIQAVAGNGPSDVQATLLEEIATRLPDVKQTRGRLESLLRTLHERQRDPAARRAAAARMAALNVPLTLPSPSPSPSAEASN